MRAYWSAASATTGRASFAELAKNLCPLGICRRAGSGGLVDQTPQSDLRERAST
jgi:hypothetical protein